MNKVQYLEALKGELAVLPSEEREAAIKYYEEYFEDAGAENVESVILELGTPESVAAKIKGVFYANNPNYTSVPPQPEQKQKLLGLPIWAIVIIALFAIPIGGPIVLGIASALFSILAAIFATVFAIIIVGIVLFIVGITVSIAGIIAMFTAPFDGMVGLAVGLVLTGIGLLLTLASTKFCSQVLPALIRWLVKVLKMPFQKRGVVV